jgi:hypothetical protein
MFRNRFIFYGEWLLAPRPTPKLEDHPLSAVCDCLFSVSAGDLHGSRPYLYPRYEDEPWRGEIHMTLQILTKDFLTCGRVSKGCKMNNGQRGANKHPHP